MTESTEKTKILIVEDELLIAADLAKRLKGLGYTVCGQAAAGKKALELVEQQQPDLVMMDVVLHGEMNGINTATVIQEKWGIPVVFLTDSSDSDRLERAKLTYPFGYIFKPFKDRELKITTEMALNMAKVDAERRNAEEALYREKKMLARTESIASIGSWEWELATDKVIWSEELFRIFQMEPSPTAPSWAEQPNFCHPEDFKLLKNATEKAIVDGIPYELELRAIRKDGEIRLCVIRGFSEKDSNGQVQRLFGLLQDITEHKQTEKALRESESFLNATGMMAKVGGWEFDASTLEVKWTDQTYRIHELPLDYKPYFEGALNFFHPDDREKLSTAFQRALDQGETFDLETRLITAKGKKLWTRVICNPQVVDGKVVKLKGTFQDITELKQAEETLRESEERYRELINKIQAAIVVHGSDTRIITCNHKAQELLGLTEDQMLGKAAIDPEWNFFKAADEILNPDEYPVNQVLATQHPLRDMTSGIYRPQTNDLVWVLVNADPVFDNENNIQQVIVTFVDITAGKKAEDALTQSESFLNATGMMAKVGGWELDASTLELKWTEQTYRIHELPLDYELGPDVSNYIHPDDREKVIVSTQSALDQGEPYDIEFRLITAKGNSLWARSLCSPQVVDGKVVKLKGTFQDITELKQAESALRESENRYRSIIEFSPLGIGIANAEGLVVDANQALASMLGYEVEDLLGMNFRDITHPDDIKRERELVEQLLNNSERSFSLEKRYRHKNGNYFWINITMAKMLDLSGNEVFVFGFVEDISYRKQMELEREKLINELQGALNEIKELRGFLPICANCKKIRDDKGYWQQVEEYIQDRTEAKFSHSICPDCMKELYPDIADRILDETNKNV